MTTVHESVTIKATREQIRPIFFDPNSLRARQALIYHYKADDEWPAAGAQCEVGFKTFLMNVDAVNTCLAFDPETMQFEFEQVSEHSTAHWLYTFDEQSGATTVSLKIDYTLPGSWLGQAIDRLLVERKNQQQAFDSLAALKEQVEAAIAVPT